MDEYQAGQEALQREIEDKINSNVERVRSEVERRISQLESEAAASSAAVDDIRLKKFVGFLVRK